MTNQTERKAFEAWARQQAWIKDCQRYPDSDLEHRGRYGHVETEKAWAAFQAGHAATIPMCEGSGSDQAVIAAFLERTGQYVTNDATRQAAIERARLEGYNTAMVWHGRTLYQAKSYDDIKGGWPDEAAAAAKDKP